MFLQPLNQDNVDLLPESNKESEKHKCGMKNKKSTEGGLIKKVTGKAVRPPHPHSGSATSDNIGSSFLWLGPPGVKNKRQ